MTPKDKTYDLVIIGTGAGLGVLESALPHGLACALVESGKFGGTCLTRGCIPSKILVHPADLVREAERAGRVGLDLRVAGFDWKVVADRMWSQINYHAEIEASLSRVPNLDVYKGTGSFTGPDTMDVRQADGTTRSLKGRRFVVAAGARSAVPPIPGLQEAGYLTSETFFGDGFPDRPWDRLLILGGGAIGTEFAHVFSAFGTKVTLVERNDRLASTEEEEISALLEDRFRSVGIEVLAGSRVVSVSRAEHGKRAEIRNEATGETRTVDCDEILVAAGIRSNADLLQAEKAGIALDARGFIVTDAYLSTSRPEIYAIGDINGRFPFRHKANYEAEILSRNLFGHGKEKAKAEYTRVPWAIFTHPQVAHVGLTEREALEKDLRIMVGINRYSAVAAGFAMGYSDGDPDDGFVKLIVDESTRILGAHIAGPHAAILIQAFVYLMNAGVGCRCAEGKPAPHLHDSVRSCLGGGLEPLNQSMVIHPALSEVAAWVIGNLEWRA